MVSALDVDPNKLIEKLATKLNDLKKPDFIGLVKTGSHNERPPEQENFWQLRCASILRQAYTNNLVGTNRLRRHYGGRKKRGVRPEHHRKSGGSTIRKALQELEKAGYMKKSKEGRSLTPKGRQLVDQTAKEIANV
ncbi:MAG TPA: 30S ribosomal protein S19e [Candidatus Bilamarchaeaceae archaeon]|nr:30S ribosomal protein S19e [Candidatus Bilamarchaeaceae archaeon]